MLNFSANLSMMFQDYTFLHRFAAAANAGFKAVEYVGPYDFAATEIAKRLDDHDLQQVLFNLPLGDWEKGERGLACLPNRKTEFQDGVKRAIEYAHILKCPKLNCLAGIAPPGVTKTELWNTLVENLSYAADALATENIELLVEPINHFDMPGYLLNTSSDGIKAIAASGHPNIRLQYDVYHMQRMEGELAATISQLLPLIGHIQIADNPGRHEPGTGEINYQFLFQHLRNLNYQGWIGCEYRPRGKTEESLNWMKSL
jgi:hydroxypyruvate isomerase